MHVVSVINYKGGVGKTSLTVNLASELAWRGKKVLLIDLDAQASLTFSLITPEAWAKDFEKDKTIKTWFDEFGNIGAKPLSGLVHRPKRVSDRLQGKGTLALICSHLGLINVDLELATKLGGANITQAKQNFISVHGRLDAALGEFYSEYELILIDCPPNFNIVTKTAIVASDFLLVPARPDYLSTLGIDYLIRSTNQLVNEYNEFASVSGGKSVEKIDPKVLGVVFTMIEEYGGQPISAHRTFMARVKAMKGVSVFDSYIKRNDTIFADAPESGIPVVLNGYTNDSHTSVVAGLENVATEFIDEVGL